VQELMLRPARQRWQLSPELGRIPARSDVARHLGVSAGEPRHAGGAELALQPSSLDAPQPGQPATSILADSLGESELLMDGTVPPEMACPRRAGEGRRRGVAKASPQAGQRQTRRW
jgi:hypothetical protein